MLPALLANEHALGIAPHTIKNGWINQAVVKHHIALLQQLLGTEREQIRITGTGADQPPLAARARGPGARQLSGKLPLNLRHFAAAVQQLARQRPIKEFVPEPAPRRQRRQRAAYALAPAPGQCRE